MSADAASRLTATNLPDDTISARVPGASAPRAPSHAPSASRRPSCCPPERLPGGDGRRPPPPPSGFRPVRLARFGRAIACLLAVPLALLLLAAETACAQIAVKLVGNTGLPSKDFGPRVDIASAFTTGSNTRGYKLTRVDLRQVTGPGSGPTYSVNIHSDSAGSPGASLFGAKRTP